MSKVIKPGSATKLPHGHDMDPEKQTDKNGLTPRQEQFCQAYLIEFNISKAARIAGLSQSAGQQLMSKEKIRKRIAQIRKDTGKALDITRERLLQELMRIVYADPRTLFDEDGKRLTPVDWDDDTASTIASVELDLLGDIKSVKRWDKTKAIELLAKMMGFNEPDKLETKNLNLNSEPVSKEDIVIIAKQLNDFL